MDITGAEDNSFNDEKYQSHRAAQSWASKTGGKEEPRLRRMMSVEGRQRDEANSQRSFLCCLFLQLRIIEENKDKRAIGYHPGLDDFGGQRR